MTQDKSMPDDATQALLSVGAPLRLGRGRPAAPLQVAYVRDLLPEDLVKGAGTHLGGAQAIKAIRQTHHTLARVLAQGTSDAEASAITGYTPSRISVLKADPTFAELLDYYMSMEAEQYNVARADMHSRLSALGFDAIETLHERLQDTPDEFDPKTLLAIVEATSDRTGHGKTSTVNHNVAHSLDDETIAKIKRNTDAGANIAEADRADLLRLAAAGTADALAEAQEAEWEPCEGDHLREEGDPGVQGEALPSSGELPQMDPVLR